MLEFARNSLYLLYLILDHNTKNNNLWRTPQWKPITGDMYNLTKGS